MRMEAELIRLGIKTFITVRKQNVLGKIKIRITLNGSKVLYARWVAQSI